MMIMAQAVIIRGGKTWTEMSKKKKKKEGKDSEEGGGRGGERDAETDRLRGPEYLF